jgi:Fe-S cluster biosynthesis and repair protein YggX
MPRTVICVKLGREAPGLDAPPFPGELGQRIFDEVSAEGYSLWSQHATILINHYGLHPSDPETRKMLRREMEEFFFGEDARLPDEWVAPGTKGAQQAPPAKGAAPARKK